MESLFHIAFWLIFGAMLGMQIYFSYRFRLVNENNAYDGMELKREGGWPTIVRVIRSAALVIFLVLYALDHRLLKLLSVPLLEWLRIIGVALGILSLVLYSWARSTLGRAWSSQLRFQANHQLITIGPYRWVRHPIYLALILFMISISLVSANWILIGFLLISFMDLMLRIPKEEQMMREIWRGIRSIYKLYREVATKIKRPYVSLEPWENTRMHVTDPAHGANSF